MKEYDPFGAPAGVPGAKLDAGKALIHCGVLAYFPRALEQVAHLSEEGAKKYSWDGWRQVPDGERRYANALGRHLLEEAVEGPYDQQTKLLHATAVAWNALARLELMLAAGAPPRLVQE